MESNDNNTKYVFYFKGSTIDATNPPFDEYNELAGYINDLKEAIDFTKIKKDIEQAYNNLTKNYLGSDSYNMEKMLETLEKEIAVLEEDYEYQLGNIKRLLESFSTQALQMYNKYQRNLNDVIL